MLQLLPRGRPSPRWSRKFVEEPKLDHDGLFVGGKPNYRQSTVSLLVISIVGLALQLLTVFHPNLRVQMVWPAASWAFACLIIAIYRPTTTPKALLVLYISIFTTQFTLLLDSISKIRPDDLPTIFVLISALVAIFVILFMPMRDPSLLNKDISSAFSPPTSELRTPEDNLTLWQFMTVSWMAPLISLGNTRQLNDDDVWFLGYEFQHRKLHDRFRELHGSVLRRLLEANGLDLFIISILAIVEQFASRLTPPIVAT